MYNVQKKWRTIKQSTVFIITPPTVDSISHATSNDKERPWKRETPCKSSCDWSTLNYCSWKWTHIWFPRRFQVYLGQLWEIWSTLNALGFVRKNETMTQFTDILFIILRTFKTSIIVIQEKLAYLWIDFLPQDWPEFEKKQRLKKLQVPRTIQYRKLSKQSLQAKKKAWKGRTAESEN